MKAKTTSLLARLALLFATVTWGSTFLIMKNALDAIDTYYLLAIRFSAAAVLLSLVFNRYLRRLTRGDLWRGAVMGVFLFTAYVLQTEGLKETTPGKNAFLTAVYCVLVPFLAWFVTRKRPTVFNLLAALICLAGIGCVSLDASLTIGRGDLLTLACGFFYAAHIVAVSAFSRNRSIITLTLLQFWTSATLAWIFALLFNKPPAAFSAPTVLSLVYLCVFGTAIAFLLQNIGQKYTSPSTASLILSLEAVFGVLCSVIFASEPLTPTIIIGFVLIFIAVLISEVLPNYLKKNNA